MLMVTSYMNKHALCSRTILTNLFMNIIIIDEFIRELSCQTILCLGSTRLNLLYKLNLKIIKSNLNWTIFRPNTELFVNISTHLQSYLPYKSFLHICMRVKYILRICTLVDISFVILYFWNLHELIIYVVHILLYLIAYFQVSFRGILV